MNFMLDEGCVSVVFFVLGKHILILVQQLLEPTLFVMWGALVYPG